MLTEQQRKMLGLADCPACGSELAAPLAAACKLARCTSCAQQFRLPSAQMLFNNAAVYLLANEIEQSENDAAHIRDLQFSGEEVEVVRQPMGIAG